MRVPFLLAALVTVLSGCSTTLSSPSATANPDTDPNVFSSIVVPGGGASRAFEVSAPGPIAVTLTATTPAGVTLGVGIGIPRGDGSCALQAAVRTTAGSGAPLAIAADSGAYCAKVYDPGTLAAPAPFTISISRP